MLEAIDNCLDFCKRQKINVKTMFILDCGDGTILDKVYKRWGVRAWSCEPDEHKFDRVGLLYKADCAHMGMEEYIDTLVRPYIDDTGWVFDLGFGHNFASLDKVALTRILRKVRPVSKYFYHEYVPLNEDHTIKEPRYWWKQQFHSVGFNSTKSIYMYQGANKLIKNY